jgi:hypothetical protein
VALGVALEKPLDVSALAVATDFFGERAVGNDDHQAGKEEADGDFKRHDGGNHGAGEGEEQAFHFALLSHRTKCGQQWCWF